MCLWVLQYTISPTIVKKYNLADIFIQNFILYNTLNKITLRIFNSKLKVNITNYLRGNSLHLPIGLVLKSLNILKKKERKSLINVKILLNFICKLYIQLFYNNCFNYFNVIGYNKYIYLLLKRSKLFRTINIKCISFNINNFMNWKKVKKIRRIKKRIKKRITNMENK